MLKINNDLERTGDLAANIAKRVLFLVERPAPDVDVDFQSMAAQAQGMLQDSLEASPAMSDGTRILSQIDSGEPLAAERLLPTVYDELRKLAAVKVAQEQSGQTLQSTALVHEAYLLLGGDGHGQHWDHRGQLFSAATEAMQRILVDAARHKQTVRHGGEHRRVLLHDYHRITESPDDLLALNEALARFAAEKPAKAESQPLETLGLVVYSFSAHFRPLSFAWAFAPVVGLLCVLTHWLLVQRED